ncbi:MAG TPA: IclR family transcriptional regulator [Stellaceae bacterium]|jgi:DNA-binding IclR family transcriptional regulator|nr:IclR family transcriptional regulator [Stellaceae bacterium]
MKNNDAELDAEGGDTRKGVQSVEHAARLLRALIAVGEAVPLKTVAAASGMSASTAHRYLTSLARVDLVRQEPVTGFYDLGPLATGLGLAALSRFDYIERADEELRGLTRRLRIDGHLSIWGDHGPTIVRIRHANSPILTNLRLGRTLPLFASATGRIFMSYLPEEMTRSLLQAELAQQPDIIEARFAAERIKQEVLQNGFAWIDGSVIPGLRSIAVPILDLQGDLRACIALVSASESLVRFPNPMLDDLLRTARETARGLGWSEPIST